MNSSVYARSINGRSWVHPALADEMGGTRAPSRKAEIQLKQLRLKFVETGWVRFISPETTHFGGGGHVLSQSSPAYCTTIVPFIPNARCGVQ